MELRLLLFSQYSTILCKQQHQDCSCACTWVSCGILSHLSHFTHVCIKLHDNNFRPVVWLWRPFHRHFAYFRRRWDSKDSIVNAFTTFLVLSFSKVLFVSFTLLNTFHVQYNYGDIPKKYFFVLWHNRGMQYTGVYYICSNCWLCASNIHHFSDNSSHSVPHKSVQEVCLMLHFSEVAWSARLWNHFKDSTRMEPMALMNSGWLLHHSLSSAY